MTARLTTQVGTVALKNPLIAASAEHLIEAEGVRRALAAGVGAVVVKSTNESQAAKDQLQRAEYMVLDEHWRPVPWDKNAPAGATIACRSGLTPQPFDAWLEQTVALDREAKACDSYAVASLILAELDPAIAMARQVEQAGVRVLELNIGTPYASQARGVVSTELDPARVRTIVAAVRAAIKIPLWVKLTGQSERVPALARRRLRGRRRFRGDGRPPARSDPRRRDLRADAGDDARHRRVLEPAAHLPLAGPHPRRDRPRQAADRHQRRAVRARHRPHDARRRFRGGDRLAGDAARFRSAVAGAGRSRRLSRAQGRAARPS